MQNDTPKTMKENTIEEGVTPNSLSVAEVLTEISSETESPHTPTWELWSSVTLSNKQKLAETEIVHTQPNSDDVASFLRASILKFRAKCTPGVGFDNSQAHVGVRPL